MGVNSLPKTVTRQRRGCELNLGPTAPAWSPSWRPRKFWSDWKEVEHTSAAALRVCVVCTQTVSK